MYIIKMSKPWFAKKIQESGLTRIGQAWSNDEEEQLLHLLSENKTIAEISTILQRTEGGINARIKIMVYNMRDTKTKEELMDIFKLDEATVSKYSKAKVERKKKNKVESTDKKEANNDLTLDDPKDFDVELFKKEFTELRSLLRQVIDKYKTLESMINM